MALDASLVRHLIFDLDDTLFDTLGMLVRPAIHESCAAMIVAGLNSKLEDCKKMYEDVTGLHPRKNPFLEIARQAGVKVGVTREAVAEAGMKAFYDREIKEHIMPFDGTHMTLEKLGSRFDLHLVTFGNPKTQRKKVELLKIGNLFKETLYVDVAEVEKKAAFQKILARFPDLKPSAFVSIGNRIDSEIRCGKELGMQTVLMLHGEYVHLQPQNKAEVPDAQIKKITELLSLFS